MSTSIVSHIKRIVLIVLLGLLHSHHLFSQTYPVQLSAFPVAPYSNHLEDYYSGSKERLIVSIINQDYQRPSLEVFLQMTISAPNGLKVQSRVDVNYPSIILEPGVSTRLSQEELAPYFENISIQGFLDKSTLPNGQIEFSFQAIEKNSRQIVSSQSVARIWLNTHKPPLLWLPQNNESIGIREPFNLKFQWEPQHKALSSVEYEFELRELPNNGVAPQSSFLYAPVIYSERTIYTSIQYNMSMPLLEPNRLYGWRVKAIGKDGIDDVSLFENQGYSEVFSFYLQDNCLAPSNLRANLQGRKIELSWLGDAKHQEFLVQYRIKDALNSEWSEISCFQANANIYKLERNETYQYRVGGICSYDGEAVFSTMQEVTVPLVDENRQANCGVMEPVDLSNREPLQELKQGDVVMVGGDFPMTVLYATGQDGVFSGEGWVPVNWLVESQWAVEFSGITINTDYRMISGSVKAKYDIENKQSLDLDEITDGGTEPTVSGIVKKDVVIDFSIPEAPVVEYNQEDGELIMFSTDGESTKSIEVPKNDKGEPVFPFIVKDKDGNVYKVDNNSTASESSGASNTENNTSSNTADNSSSGGSTISFEKIGNESQTIALSESNKLSINRDYGLVTFQNPSNASYALDKGMEQYLDIAQIYQDYDVLTESSTSSKDTKPYIAPWKFLPEGGSDEVKAIFSSGLSKEIAAKPSDVIFATPQGMQYESNYNSSDKSYSIKLSAGKQNEKQEIYALYPYGGTYFTLGKLNVITYRKQEHRLVVVNVIESDSDNRINTQELEGYLNEVYLPVGVRWRVDETQFHYQGNTKDFFANSSGLLSDYNANMQALQKAFMAENEYDKNACYAFILSSSGKQNDRNTQGFMPRGRQFAYIFKKDAKKELNHTIAHELGHGIFKLQHTFNYGKNILKEGSTNNLMDYTKSGTEIARWQWNRINTPAVFINPFEGDEEGLVVDEAYSKALSRLIKTINCAINSGASSVKLYLPNSRINANIKSLVSELYLAGSSCADDAVIKATLYKMFGEVKDFGNDYLVDVFDLSQIQYSERSKAITLSGSKYTLILSAKDNCTYNFIKSNLLGSLHISKKPIDFASLDELQYASPCELENLSIKNRKELLRKIQSETNWYNSSLRDSRQKITIDLISSALQSTELYQFLYDNPAIINNLYDRIDDYREQYLQVVNDLWKNNKDAEIQAKVLPLVQFSLAHTNAVMEVDDKGYLNFYQSYLNGGNPYVGFSYGSKNLGSYHPLEAVEVYLQSTISSLFTGPNEHYAKIPAILARSIQEEARTDEFWNYVQIATLPLGFSQASLGAKLLASNVKSVSAWTHLALGIADVATYPIEEYVKVNPNSEFSMQWSENRTLIYGGLLVGNAAVSYASYAKKAKQLEELYLKETGIDFGDYALGVKAKLPPEILTHLGGFSDDVIQTFIRDFGKSDEILAIFAKDPDLVKAWGKALGSGDDDLVKAINSLKGDADELANVLKHVDDIDAAGGYKVWRERLTNIIYPVTTVNGVTVVRILEGSNGKIALIGRRMSYIEDVADALKKLGKEVEIFDVKSAFGGSGYKDWDLIKSDWEDALRKYGQLDGNANKVLPYDKVKQTLWYKENKRWARWVKQQGYDIYDLGDNPGLQNITPPRSAFYDLEKSIIFND